MTSSTRALGTAAAATLVAATAFYGTRFLAIGIAALIVVAALGWPRLLRVYRRWVAAGIIAAAGAISIIAVGLGRGEPYLRYAVAAAGAAVLLAMAAEVFFPSPPGRAVASVTGMMAGAMVAVSSAAWVAAARTPGASDLVVAAAAAVAVAGVATTVTRNQQVAAATAVVVSTGLGAALGQLLSDIGWIAGAFMGIVGAAVVLLMAELASREPAPRAVLPAIASGITPVLAMGVLVYLTGRLWVG